MSVLTSHECDRRAETFGNLLLLYIKYQHYDLAADVLAENAHLTLKFLSQARLCPSDVRSLRCSTCTTSLRLSSPSRRRPRTRSRNSKSCWAVIECCMR